MSSAAAIAPVPVAGTPEPTLPEYTNAERKAPAIAWYRTKLPPGELKALHNRSDLRGGAQTLGFLAVLGGAFALAVYSAARWPWWATVGSVFLYGMIRSFLINAVHELGHGTVFRTKALNRFFTRVFAFVGRIHFEKFEHSHTRHHRYTLHAPDDLEVVLPIKLMVRHVLKVGFFDWRALWGWIPDNWRLAKGDFRGDWELMLFPPGEPEKRTPIIRWARILLVGHALIAIVSLCLGWWIVPVLTLVAPAMGGWLFFLCNNTQHIGLIDSVPDFRLCCRTFTLNPVVQFLYWHMNYHTEHHMYAAVPCYNLGKLHRAIRQDLPPTAHGIAAVWRDIGLTQKRQETDPTYQLYPLEPGVPVGSNR